MVMVELDDNVRMGLAICAAALLVFEGLWFLSKEDELAWESLLGDYADE